MIKTSINLYTASLLPQQQRLTLLRLGVVLTFMIGASVVFYGFGLWQQSDLHVSEQQTQQENNRLAEQKIQLEALIAARKPDANLVAKVELEQQRLDLKVLLKDELSQRKTLISQGYSPMLTDLASVADANVWLSHIQIEQTNGVSQSIEFEGFGRHPQSIPLWIDKLKTTSTLKGYAFSAMTIDRGETQPLSFKLTSQPIDQELPQ